MRDIAHHAQDHGKVDNFGMVLPPAMLARRAHEEPQLVTPRAAQLERWRHFRSMFTLDCKGI
jgi:hypothetical protein